MQKTSPKEKPSQQSLNRVPEIPTHIKDANLVQQRRRQIVDAAVKLFVENGFHKTTTRQIARATGFSIGSLYEYVASKEDVLYLVCDAIHAEVERSVAKILSGVPMGREALSQVIREYLTICDRMSDHILLMYQVTQFLPPQWKKKVLENELRITGLFKEVLRHTTSSSDLPKLNENTSVLVAHNISVLGQAWAFRRWFFARHCSIEEFIAFQTQTIFGIFSQNAI